MAFNAFNQLPGRHLNSMVWVWVLVVLWLAPPVQAESLRVTTWNLALETNYQNTAAVIFQAASTLRALDPDVILLQHVQDWQMCQQLVDALAPADYKVLICSAFERASPLSSPKPQVAILSKAKAYFTWSQQWPARTPTEPADGFGFAAIQAGTRKLGFYTMLCSGRIPPVDFANRFLSEIKTISGWETNQVQTFVVGASSDPFGWRSARVLRKMSSPLEQAGMVDAAETLPSEVKGTLRPTPDRRTAVADSLFAGPEGFPLNTRITACAFYDHYPVTCDIELDPEKVTTAMDIRNEERRERRAQTALLIRQTGYTAGGTIGVGVVLWMVLSRRAKKRVSTAFPGRGFPVRMPPNAAGSSPMRPVVLSRPPAKTITSAQPALPQNSRLLYRLQGSDRTTPQDSPQDSPPQSNLANPEPSEPENGRAATGRPARLDPAVLPASPGIEDLEVRQGVIKELTQWLKRKLVRRLVSDRAELMQAQQIATHMAATLDNRLARIEAQIEQQNQAYNRRIEELNKELAAAREENRQLIRERIAQVKAEMEAARSRVLAEANLDSNSFRL